MPDAVLVLLCVRTRQLVRGPYGLLPRVLVGSELVFRRDKLLLLFRALGPWHVLGSSIPTLVHQGRPDPVPATEHTPGRVCWHLVSGLPLR